MVAIFIGLGSNIGSKKKNILEAARLISKDGHFKILILSSPYLTKAVGPAQPDFVNAVLKAETALKPEEALADLKKIEKLMGRRKTKRWGPRIIDLDILFYGAKVIRTKKLTIPHKELHKRGFVLAPLAEISPKLRHPVLKETVIKLLNKLKACKCCDCANV